MKLYIKEENLSGKENVKICDEQLKPVYITNKDGLSVDICDSNSSILATIVTKDAKWLKQVDIYFDDSLVASLKRDFSSFVEKKYIVPMNYEIRGDVKNHQIQIYNGQKIVASYEKKWLTYQSAYEISFEKEEDQLLIVSIIVALEMSNE